MKKSNKIIIVLITLLLSACGSRPPSEADGWRLADNEVDVYVRETIYTMDDDKMTEYLEVHEGTWTASEDPEVAIIIENGSIFVGLHSGFNVYPVSSYELEEMQYTSKENDYKPGRPAYTLSLKVPDFFVRYVDEMSTFYTFLDESIYSDDNYGFIFTAGTDGKIASYSMERSNHQYSIIDNRINQQDVYEDENEENKPKKETAGQRAKREAEARREQEARRRESKRREEEAARQEELEEQRKQEEEAVRLEEERRITEEREQQSRIDESIKLINNIVNKHLGSFLNGEYELSFISSYKEIIQIVPNSNAYNGNIDSFFQNERLTEEVPTDEWIKLTNIMINLSKELSKEFPDQNLQIQLTDTNHTTGYLILENGEVTQDFAYYY